MGIGDAKEKRRIKEAFVYEYFYFRRKEEEATQRIRRLEADYPYIKAHPTDRIPIRGSQGNTALYRLIEQKEKIEAEVKGWRRLAKEKERQLGLDNFTEEEMKTLRLRFGDFRSYQEIAEKIPCAVSTLQYQIDHLLDRIDTSFVNS